MVKSVLNEIIAKRRLRLAEDRAKFNLDQLRENAAGLPRRSLKAALRQPGIGLIAEIKGASPSRGRIRANFSVSAIAGIYAAAGAAAISVLTEPDWFNGKWRYLTEARRAGKVPILCKDFIIDQFQLFLAAAHGADAVLLIAAALTDEEQAGLIDQAHALGLEVLTEAINADELKRTVAGKTDVIGINSRNLHTLEIDVDRARRLLAEISDSRPVVMESGISEREDVIRLEKDGADGILVGTSLMSSEDIGAKARELLGTD